MSQKLYKVTCQGMQSSLGHHVVHGIAFVVADDPATAYRKLRDYLDKYDIGFHSERELDKVELIAEETAYPDCKFRLFADDIAKEL